MCSSNKQHTNNWGNLLKSSTNSQQSNCCNSTNSWQRSGCGSSQPKTLVFHGDSAPVGMYLVRELMGQHRTKILSAQKAWILGVCSTKGSSKFGNGGRSTMLAFGRSASHAYRMTFLEAAGVDPEHWPSSGESGYKNEDKLQFEQLIGNKFVLACSFKDGRRYWAEFDKMFPHYLIERHLEEKIPSLNNIMYIFRNNMREVLEITVNVSAEFCPPCTVNSNICVTVVQRELCMDGAEGPWLDALSMISIGGCCPMAKQYDTVLSLRSNSMSCDKMNCCLNVPLTMLPHTPDEVRGQRCDCNGMLQICNNLEKQISCGQTELQCVRPTQCVMPTTLCTTLPQVITTTNPRSALQISRSKTMVIKSHSEKNHHRDDQYKYDPAKIKENFSKCVQKHRTSDDYVDGTTLRGCAAKAFYDERKKQDLQSDLGKPTEREPRGTLNGEKKEAFYLEISSKTCAATRKNVCSDPCTNLKDGCKDPCQPLKFSIASRDKCCDPCCAPSQGSGTAVCCPEQRCCPEPTCCPEINCCPTECKVRYIAIPAPRKKSRERCSYDDVEIDCYGKKKISCEGLTKRDGVADRDVNKCVDVCLKRSTKLGSRSSGTLDQRSHRRHRSRSEQQLSEKYVDEEEFSKCFCKCTRSKATPIDRSRDRTASERYYRKSSDQDDSMDRHELPRYKSELVERSDDIRHGKSLQKWDNSEKRNEEREYDDRHQGGHQPNDERDRRSRSSTKHDPDRTRDFKYEGEKSASNMKRTQGGSEISRFDRREPKLARSELKESGKLPRLDVKEWEKPRDLERSEYNREKLVRSERRDAAFSGRSVRSRRDRSASPNPLLKQRRSIDMLAVHDMRREGSHTVTSSEERIHFNSLGTNTSQNVKTNNGTQVKMYEKR